MIRSDKHNRLSIEEEQSKLVHQWKSLFPWRKKWGWWTKVDRCERCGCKRTTEKYRWKWYVTYSGLGMGSDPKDESPQCFDPIKETTDLLEWAKWYEDHSKRIVKQTYLPGGTKISTVFLGINHGWGDGPPVLFETMIFGGEHDEFQERYCTYEEAEAGHQAAIEMIFEVNPNS